MVSPENNSNSNSSQSQSPVLRPSESSDSGFLPRSLTLSGNNHFSSDDHSDEDGEERSFDDSSSHHESTGRKSPIMSPLSSSSSGSTGNAPVYSPAVLATLLGPASSSHLTATRLPNPPTFIEWKNLRFLIMDAPSESNLHLYLKEMSKYNVRDVVRVCEPTYSKDLMRANGIQVHDWVFPDGEGPPDAVIRDWLHLVNARFKKEPVVYDGKGDEGMEAAIPNLPVTIGTHCVAGLGRAPVLVAIALIEDGMSPLDAVMFIREKRRGAINNKQLRFLEHYKPRSRAIKDKCRIM